MSNASERPGVEPGGGRLWRRAGHGRFDRMTVLEAIEARTAALGRS